MLEITEKLATEILNSRNDRGKCDFGYICEHGAIVGEAEFTVYQEDGGRYFLIHKSELESEGVFIRIKKGKQFNAI